MLGREVARDLKRQCMQEFVVSVSSKIMIGTFSPNLCVKTACWLNIAMYQIMGDA